MPDVRAVQRDEALVTVLGVLYGLGDVLHRGPVLARAERCERGIDVRLGVRGAEREPDAAAPGRDGGRADGFRQDALLAQARRSGDGPLGSAQQDGEDGRILWREESRRAQAGSESADIAPEARPPLVPFRAGEDAERLERSAGQRRWQG